MYHTKKDKIILFFNKILLIFLVLLIVLPLLYVLLASFLDPTVLLSKGISLKPADWTIDGYVRILQDDSIIRGFFNAVLYSVGFTLATVIVSIFAGYSLSIDGLAGKKVIMGFFLFTMFFGGGLIPTYLVVKNVGMLNSIWAIILPGAVSVWNIILARTFLKVFQKNLMKQRGLMGRQIFKYFLRSFSHYQSLLFLY